MSLVLDVTFPGDSIRQMLSVLAYILPRFVLLLPLQPQWFMCRGVGVLREGSVNLTRQMERFQNLLDLIHLSIGGRAHKKGEGAWMSRLFIAFQTDPGDFLLPVEPVSSSSEFVIGTRTRTRRASGLCKDTAQFLDSKSENDSDESFLRRRREMFWTLIS